MLKVFNHQSLGSFNTLAIPAEAEYFCRLTDVNQIPELLSQAKTLNRPVRVLGGGSNLILSERVHALVTKVELTGSSVQSEDEDSVLLKVHAGENWHDFVQSCVNQGYFGLENLALIPGTVGASPVQNIGAYGVEVGSCIEQVDAVDLTSGRRVSFKRNECQFAYRDSYFKQHENRYLITAVQFRLSKRFDPVLSYGPLVDLQNEPALTAQDVFDRVVSIRCEKLPDPTQIPNAGSFFKNPIVNESQHNELLKEFPNLVSFAHHGDYKLAAGWLIDQAGFKGKSNQYSVGCYSKQALVIINPEHAPYSAVNEWVGEVGQAVFGKFGVTLEPEPRHWK